MRNDKTKFANVERKVIIISTKLFSLKPIGLNTELVESLTSYISRLADAHCLSVGTLIGKVLTPLLMKEYLKNSTENGGSRLYDFACEINGLGEQAYDFANVLSLLTGIDRLWELTFISWKGIFPVRDVFRKSKVWCPLCYETSKKNGQAIYEPLIWSFKAVNICGIHSVKLENRCPICKKEIPILSRKMRNGYCPYCGCWLGSDKINANQINTNELLWNKYLVTNIGSLIKMGNELSGRVTDSSIYSFIKSVVENVGGVHAFSRDFDIPLSTIRLWIREMNKPSLYKLLKICYKVGINITDIFSTEQFFINFVPIDKSACPVIENKCLNKKKRRKIDWRIIENELKNIADNESGAL